MRWTILTPAVALAAVLAAPAAAAVSDFRLPGDPSAQQPPPDRVGPVAPDVPESRAQPAPAPSAGREPAPTPPASQTAPTIVLPDLAETAPAPAPPARATRDPAAVDGAARTVAPATDASAPAAAPTTAAEPGFAVPSPIAASSAPVPAGIATDDGEGISSWLLILGALAALFALAFAGWMWLRLRPAVKPPLVVQVERPRLQPAAPVARSEPTAAEPLQVTLEPLRLSLTLMNATLAYRLEISNRGLAPIEALRVGADMIAAHASMTREQQLSGPGDGAATVQRIERIEPGESRIVEGEFRVPFSQIVPIRQGNAALLLPLARFRLEAEGAAPVVRTFAVGQPGTKAALQPFRLDLGPRVYPKLAQRAFA
jgi:hypothetical protein